MRKESDKRKGTGTGRLKLGYKKVPVRERDADGRCRSSLRFSNLIYLTTENMKTLKNKVKYYLIRLSKVRYFNRWVIFVIDLFLSVLATGLIEVFIETNLRIPVFSTPLLILASLGVSAASIFFFRTYIGVIRYATLREVWRLLFMAVIKDVLLGFCIVFGQLLPGHIFLFLFADFFVTFVTLLGVRLLMLNVYNAILKGTYVKKKSILIYGIGENSVTLSQGGTQVYMSDYVVRGFIVNQHKKRHFRISGYSVYGVESEEELKDLVIRHNIDGVLFPNVKLAQKEKEGLIPMCDAINLRTLVVPSAEEMKNGVIPRSIRRVRIEDLLGRDEIEINLHEISTLLKGKTVLVTGAAGSIGSEICRQLARFNIERLVCYDMGETPMHNIRLELEEKFPYLNFLPIIGDVRSRTRLDYVFSTYRPQVVFHAAAYKHVPLMEENPCEAIRVNVFGSRNVADMAVKYGVERFVMVSTDKAVNPTNIMGCSKRLAEIYVQSLSLAIKKGEVAGKTKFITTRFGNVLGSNGSVIPRFKEQIKNGGPVTVTHPDIIRFFMTIPEACRLVLEAGTMGNGGEIFVFDMGEPVKIADLARRMIILSGFRPDRDIRIEYTGLRPGEKLYEEVLSDKENTKETPHPKIHVAAVREYNYSEILPLVEQLTQYSTDVRIPEMVKLMKSVVPEFKSKNSIYEKYDK